MPQKQRYSDREMALMLPIVYRHGTKTPILVAGLPRTGTTWIASVLGATAGTTYFHEPFNYRNVKESAPFTMRYLRSDDDDPKFAAYCEKCFAGRQRHRAVTLYQSIWRRRLPLPAGRVLIKDVHTFLALAWIHRHFGPRIVVVLRHPLAVADSWFRMVEGKGQELGIMARLLTQPALLDDYLRPFEGHLRAAANDFWSCIAAYWAACTHVVLQQQQRYPEWIVVRHEDFFDDPKARFRDLCSRLDLPWTAASERYLRDSNAADSGKLYVPKRVIADERDKWRRKLTPEQVETVRRGVAPFDLQVYSLTNQASGDRSQGLPLQ
jgi:Sulfotransferase family